MGDVLEFRISKAVPDNPGPLYGQEPGSTAYHESAEQLFALARDDSRFAGGVTWICLRCGNEATVSEDWDNSSELFLLRKLSCGVCGRWWLTPGAYRFVCIESLAISDAYEYWILLMQSWAHYAMSEEA